MLGFTDAHALRSLLEESGPDGDGTRFPHLVEAIRLEAAARRSVFARVRLRSHALEAIAAVAQLHIEQTIVTANLRCTGLAKIRSVGLDLLMNMTFAVFGDDPDSAKEDLLRQAIGIASAHRPVICPARTVCVGDSRFDMLAAKGLRCAAVGVAGGVSTVEELKLAGADTVIQDLELLTRSSPVRQGNRTTCGE